MSDAAKGPKSYFPSIVEKYGQPIAHWMSLLGEVQGQKHMDQVDWLKTAHGMGHGHANALVHVHRAEHGADQRTGP